MKKLVIFSVTALAAAVLTGMPAMTSQAAACTYQVQAGNCSCSDLFGTDGNSSCQNGDVIFDGNSSMDGGFLKPIKPGQGEILPGVSGNGNQDQPGQDEQKPGNPGENSQKPGNPENPDQDNQKPNEIPDVQDAYVEQVLELVNEERAKTGAEALTLDSNAEDAAQLRAEEIQSDFSHTRPDGSSFSTALTQAGVNYSAYGENIAYGQNSPQAVMESWMNSSGHRANILNQSFTSIGIGHAQDANGVDYWTQLFFR